MDINTKGVYTTAARRIQRSCVIAAPTEPPDDRKAISMGGVVHGEFTTIRPQNPILIIKYAKLADTAGAIIKGTARIGFSTIGSPKVTGSLMLKKAHGIAIFATAL